MEMASCVASSCYNVGVKEKKTITVAICLRLATASHRKRFAGIFKAWGASRRWNPLIIQDERELAKLLAARSPIDAPDGIISGVPYSAATQEAIGKSSIPFVGIGNFDEALATRDHAIGFVHNDNCGIGIAAAGHFLSHGAFRSFAYVPDTLDREWSRIRGEAFRLRLEGEGMQCLTYIAPPSGTGHSAHLGAFLSGLQKPAAVFAAWDGRGADVIAAARMAGLAVPGDISVLGVDNDEIICEHTEPPLSSVITDAEGMGEAAAQELARLIGRNGSTSLRETVCPILGIAERESTKPPSPAGKLIDRALSFISREAKNGITPDDVARHVNVSRRLLDLRFRQYEGHTVRERIVESRLVEVRRLLAGSSASIRSVFELAGFGSPTHGYRLFKRQHGITPEAWRNINRPKGSDDGAAKPFDGFERIMSLSDRDADDLRTLAGELDGNATFDRKAVERELSCGRIRLYALRKRHRIVACATAVSFATPTGLHCRIEDVVVGHRERGNGLGREIMENMLHELKKDGVGSVELTSRPSRIAANAMYRSLGFQIRNTNVYELSL